MTAVGRTVGMAIALVCASGLSRGQSLECIDAFDTITRIKEKLFSTTLSKKDIELLHHQVKTRTSDCEDIKELWQLRSRLALMAGDKGDAEIVRKRGSDYFAVAADLEAIRLHAGGFNPSTPVRKRWALLAGTGQWLEKAKLDKLEFANQDLEQMRSVFSSRLGFDDVQTLIGDQFTHEAFRKQITRLRESTEEDDLVVIFLLSHGYPTTEDVNGTSFILTYDSRVRDAQQRYLTSIQAVGLVQELYRELRAKRIVLLLDSCYSGDAISGQRYYAGHPSPQLLQAFTRASGRAVLTAARADQRSYELQEKGHGSFVYCFDQATRVPENRTLGELYDSIRTCVPAAVSGLGQSYRQDPSLFASDGALRIVLANPTRAPK